MLRYVAHRLLLGLVSLLLLSMMIYAAAQVLPGNPGRLVLGREATPDAVRLFNHRLGVDRPLPVRYGDWLGHALRGDFRPKHPDGPAGPDHPGRRPWPGPPLPAPGGAMFPAHLPFSPLPPGDLFRRRAARAGAGPA